jgi:hypothetical protein
MTLVIDRLTHRFAVQNYLFTLLGVIFVGLAIMWLMLGVSSNPYLIFTLPLFFELLYMLFSLQFVALLSRLLNVRQTKRLSGITRSGEFLAEIAGGFLVIVLLNFIQVTDLLDIQPLANRVLGRIEQEPDPAVRGQALMTYAALAAPDTIDMLKPYLDSSDQNLRKGPLSVFCLLTATTRMPMTIYSTVLDRGNFQNDFLLQRLSVKLVRATFQVIW